MENTSIVIYLYYYQRLNSRHIWNLEEAEFWGQTWTNPDHWHNNKPQGLVLQECLLLSLFDQGHCKHLRGKTLLVTAINQTKWPYSEDSFIVLLGSLAALAQNTTQLRSLPYFSSRRRVPSWCSSKKEWVAWLPAPFNFLVISGSQTPYIYIYLF